MEKEDPENSSIFKERAKEFAKTFVYWFDESGASLEIGGSGSEIIGFASPHPAQRKAMTPASNPAIQRFCFIFLISFPFPKCAFTCNTS